jgi:biopolymer transport protein ExbD
MRIPRKKRTSRIVVPVTAMGDIAFLLIIFFMVASQFAKESHVRVDRPQAPRVSELEKSRTWVTLDEGGQLWVDGEASSIAEVGGRVGALLSDRADKSVLVKIDRNLLKASYEPLLVELSLAGALISLVGDEEPVVPAP